MDWTAGQAVVFGFVKELAAVRVDVLTHFRTVGANMLIDRGATESAGQRWSRSTCWAEPYVLS